MKNMKTLSFPILILKLIIIINCGSCKQKPPEDTDIGVICNRAAEAPKNFRNMFLFKKGSWWKYNLVGTNDTDIRTVTLFDSVFYDIKASANFGILPCIYRYRCNTSHSHPSFKSSNQSYGDQFNIVPEGDSLHWFIQHSCHSNYYSLETFALWPLKEKTTFGNYYMLDSLDAKVVVKGNTLSCLKIKKVSINTSDTNFIESIYFSTGVGLVKYTIIPNKTWILKQYDIKQ